MIATEQHKVSMYILYACAYHSRLTSISLPWTCMAMVYTCTFTTSIVQRIGTQPLLKGSRTAGEQKYHVYDCIDPSPQFYKLDVLALEAVQRLYGIPYILSFATVKFYFKVLLDAWRQFKARLPIQRLTRMHIRTQLHHAHNTVDRKIFAGKIFHL